MQRALLIVSLVLVFVVTAVSSIKEQRLSAELKSSRSQIAFLQEQITSLEAEKERLLEKEAAWTADKSTAEEKTRAFEELQKQVQGETANLGALTVENEALQKRVSELEAELASLRSAAPSQTLP